MYLPANAGFKGTATADQESCANESVAIAKSGSMIAAWPGSEKKVCKFAMCWPLVLQWPDCLMIINMSIWIDRQSEAIDWKGGLDFSQIIR